MQFFHLFFQKKTFFFHLRLDFMAFWWYVIKRDLQLYNN